MWRKANTGVDAWTWKQFCLKRSTRNVNDFIELLYINDTPTTRRSERITCFSLHFRPLLTFFLRRLQLFSVSINMGKSKQKGSHKKKNPGKIFKTKRRTKDLDQIHSDLKPETASKLLHQEVDYDVSGCAQHYCLHCAWVLLVVYLNNAFDLSI